MSVDLAPALDSPFVGISRAEAARFGPLTRGKVRDVVDLGDSPALIATDRVSAFDHVLGTVPYRGQILTQLAAWWFERIDDIVATHVVSVPDPNVTIARRCRVLPVEVVVRGHLSGSTSTSLWTAYEAGAREIYGLRFPDGLRKNDPLAAPVVTPTTKATQGAHDEPISEADIVERNLVDARLWDRVRTAALRMFARGSEVAAAAGLVLVDTKYEFGLDDDGALTVIDEVHTPDSSRYWRASTVQQRLAAGMEPESLDKEHIRLAYVRSGYTGDGPPGPLTRELAVGAARLYVETFAMLTGGELEPAPYPAAPRVLAALDAAVGSQPSGDEARPSNSIPGAGKEARERAH